MSIKFNISEILDMAARIERNGGLFYRKAADICTDCSDFLNEIAREEDRHLAAFKEMKGSMDSNPDTLTFDPNNEAALYLEALADQQVFKVEQEPADLLTGNETVSDIAHMAIGAEKESIVFYLGMKELVPDNLGGTTIMEIVREEMKHIRWLSEKTT